MHALQSPPTLAVPDSRLPPTRRTPANFLEEAVLLAKQHRATLKIGYGLCEVSTTELQLLMHRPTVVDFAPLALYPELTSL